MTEEEAVMKIREEVEQIKLRFGLYRGFSSVCRRDGKFIIRSDIYDMSTECDECYAERRLNELFTVEERKKARLKTLKEYFDKRKKLE